MKGTFRLKMRMNVVELLIVSKLDKDLLNIVFAYVKQTKESIKQRLGPLDLTCEIPLEYSKKKVIDIIYRPMIDVMDCGRADEE